jgi:hypothetical protein
MWYDELGVISIGAQCGGPQDGGLSKIKVDLWNLLVRHCRSSYCPAVAHYALALRIDGAIQTFGAEGIERVRRSKRGRYIGADIVIPLSAWQGKSPNELRDYLARQVRAALASCVARLRKDKETVDEAPLFREIDAAIAEFRRIDYVRDA